MCFVDETKVFKRAQIRINKIIPIFFGDYVKFSDSPNAKKEIIRHRKCHFGDKKEFAGVCIYYTQSNKRKNKFISHVELAEEFLYFEESGDYVFPMVEFLNNLDKWLGKVSRKAFATYVEETSYE